MANTMNQGSGRLTRGANGRIANRAALANHIENYQRAKQIRNQKITVTDSVTGESKIITRAEFVEITTVAAAAFTFDQFEKVQSNLFAGKPVEIGANIFQILQVEVTA